MEKLIYKIGNCFLIRKLLYTIFPPKTIRSVYKKFCNLPFIRPSNRSILLDIQKSIRDIDFKQNLIMDYYLDVSAAKKATGALALRHSELLIILSEFIRICEKYHLNYWLDFGCLLGAKRHGGFIPWDDDLDVSMLEKDFNNLVEVLRQGVLGEKFTWEFPNLSELQSRPLRIYSRESKSFIDIFFYIEKEDRIRLYKYYGYPRLCYQSVPKNIMFPLKIIDFEGLSVKVPCNVDTYLRGRYRDYMKFPKHTHPMDHGDCDDSVIFYPGE